MNRGEQVFCSDGHCTVRTPFCYQKLWYPVITGTWYCYQNFQIVIDFPHLPRKKLGNGNELEVGEGRGELSWLETALNVKLVRYMYLKYVRNPAFNVLTRHSQSVNFRKLKSNKLNLWTDFGNRIKSESPNFVLVLFPSQSSKSTELNRSQMNKG